MTKCMNCNIKTTEPSNISYQGISKRLTATACMNNESAKQHSCFEFVLAMGKDDVEPLDARSYYCGEPVLSGMTGEQHNTFEACLGIVSETIDKIERLQGAATQELNLLKAMESNMIDLL